MADSAVIETLRAIFRALPGGGLRLRKPPTAKIDQRVLREVFSPAQALKVIDRKNADQAKPAAAPRKVRVVSRRPKK